MLDGIAVATGLLLVLAAASDIRSRLIPNWISLALAGLFALAALIGAPGVEPMGGVAVAVATFVVLFACFLAGLLGGGDVKLLSAAALWAGPQGLGLLLLTTALLGGLLAAGALVLRGIRRLAGVRRTEQDSKTAIPYGVAISGAALLAIPFLHAA